MQGAALHDFVNCGEWMGNGATSVGAWERGDRGVHGVEHRCSRRSGADTRRLDGYVSLLSASERAW